MTAEITLTDGVLNCNADGFDNPNFAWQFRASIKSKWSALNKKPSCNFIGSGEYICVVTQGEHKVTASMPLGVIDEKFIKGWITPAEPKKWDWSKLPKEQHQVVRKLAWSSKWKEIALIHNEYNLTDSILCCGRGNIKFQVDTAIKEGLI